MKIMKANTMDPRMRAVQERGKRKSRKKCNASFCL